ncbi:hypothetical protein M9H77_23418 [Catharanthus roseus]|uniref:Uncharacterized protein n=1 Tax=Catharanthus roseus TaxID=4058 RepID=A0ACC0AUS4_CATRO|nr:hypothetical protein M9H77_23418 [Catharanthus roseus]
MSLILIYVPSGSRNDERETRNGRKRSENDEHGSRQQSSRTYCGWKDNLPSPVGSENGQTTVTQDLPRMGEKRFSSKESTKEASSSIPRSLEEGSNLVSPCIKESSSEA